MIFFSCDNLVIKCIGFSQFWVDYTLIKQLCFPRSNLFDHIYWIDDAFTNTHVKFYNFFLFQILLIHEKSNILCVFFKYIPEIQLKIAQIPKYLHNYIDDKYSDSINAWCEFHLIFCRMNNLINPNYIWFSSFFCFGNYLWWRNVKITYLLRYVVVLDFSGLPLESLFFCYHFFIREILFLDNSYKLFRHLPGKVIIVAKGVIPRIKIFLEKQFLFKKWTSMSPDFYTQKNSRMEWIFSLIIFQ